ISPDGGAYAPDTDILPEDPGALRDVVAAALELAQPLLAGVIRPIQLPRILGLHFEVQGIAGAAPFGRAPADGYQHLAIWARVNECGTGAPCQPVSLVKTQVRAAERAVPESLAAVRAGGRPELRLELSAPGARTRPQFSY